MSFGRLIKWNHHDRIFLIIREFKKNVSLFDSQRFLVNSFGKFFGVSQLPFDDYNYSNEDTEFISNFLL